MREDYVKELRIQNFLSIESVRMRLGKLSILVGLNASGKSNIVKALHILSRLPNERFHDIHNRMGINDPLSLIFNFQREKRLKLGAVLQEDDGELLYEVEITREGQIFRERVKLQEEVLLNRRKEKVEVAVATEGQKEMTAKSSFFSYLADLPTDTHPLIFKIRDVLSNIRTYSFDPDKIRSFASSGLQIELDSNGENLAQVLHALLTSQRKKYVEIEGIVKDLIPEIEEIAAPTTTKGDQVYIAIKERDVSGSLDHANISDGTLRILAFAAAISLGGSLVAFEEPENCVHPYLFETIIDLCRKIPNQVLITTHSPHLLDKAKPEELCLVAKRQGRSVVRQLTQKEKVKVKKMLEEGLSLGDTWYSGELDGAFS